MEGQGMNLFGAFDDDDKTTRVKKSRKSKRVSFAETCKVSEFLTRSPDGQGGVCESGSSDYNAPSLGGVENLLTAPIKTDPTPTQPPQHMTLCLTRETDVPIHNDSEMSSLNSTSMLHDSSSQKSLISGGLQHSSASSQSLGDKSGTEHQQSTHAMVSSSYRSWENETTMVFSESQMDLTEYLGDARRSSISDKTVYFDQGDMMEQTTCLTGLNRSLSAPLDRTVRFNDTSNCNMDICDTPTQNVNKIIQIRRDNMPAMSRNETPVHSTLFNHAMTAADNNVSQSSAAVPKPDALACLTKLVGSDLVLRSPSFATPDRTSSRSVTGRLNLESPSTPSSGRSFLKRIAGEMNLDSSIDFEDLQNATTKSLPNQTLIFNNPDDSMAMDFTEVGPGLGDFGLTLGKGDDGVDKVIKSKGLDVTCNKDVTFSLNRSAAKDATTKKIWNDLPSDDVTQYHQADKTVMMEMTEAIPSSVATYLPQSSDNTGSMNKTHHFERDESMLMEQTEVLHQTPAVPFEHKYETIAQSRTSVSKVLHPAELKISEKEKSCNGDTVNALNQSSSKVTTTMKKWNDSPCEDVTQYHQADKTVMMEMTGAVPASVAILLPQSSVNKGSLNKTHHFETDESMLMEQTEVLHPAPAVAFEHNMPSQAQSRMLATENHSVDELKTSQLGAFDPKDISHTMNPSSITHAPDKKIWNDLPSDDVTQYHVADKTVMMEMTEAVPASVATFLPQSSDNTGSMNKTHHFERDESMLMEQTEVLHQTPAVPFEQKSETIAQSRQPITKVLDSVGLCPIGHQHAEETDTSESLSHKSNDFVKDISFKETSGIHHWPNSQKSLLGSALLKSEHEERQLECSQSMFGTNVTDEGTAHKQQDVFDGQPVSYRQQLNEQEIIHHNKSSRLNTDIKLEERHQIDRPSLAGHMSGCDEETAIKDDTPLSETHMSVQELLTDDKEEHGEKMMHQKSNMEKSLLQEEHLHESESLLGKESFGSRRQDVQEESLLEAESFLAIESLAENSIPSKEKRGIDETLSDNMDKSVNETDVGILQQECPEFVSSFLPDCTVSDSLPNISAHSEIILSSPPSKKLCLQHHDNSRRSLNQQQQQQHSSMSDLTSINTASTSLIDRSLAHNKSTVSEKTVFLDRSVQSDKSIASDKSVRFINSLLQLEPSAAQALENQSILADSAQNQNDDGDSMSIEDRLALCGISLRQRSKQRRSTMAATDMSKAESVSDVLLLSLPQTETEITKWANDYMEKTIPDLETKIKDHETVLKQDPPEVLRAQSCSEKSRKSMRQLLSRCSKSSKASFKQWKAKLLKSQTEALQPEEELLTQMLDQMQKSLTQATALKSSLQQAVEDIDSIITEFESSDDNQQNLQPEAEEARMAVSAAEERVMKEQRGLSELKMQHVEARDELNASTETTDCEQRDDQLKMNKLYMATLSAVAPFGIKEWVQKKGTLALLSGHLLLHIKYESLDSGLTAFGLAVKKIIDVTTELVNHGCDAITRLVASLLKQEVDDMDLSCKCPTTTDLFPMLHRVGHLNLLRQQIVRDLKFASFTHDVNVNGNNLEVDFSSLKAHCEFSLTFTLDTSNFSDMAWSFKHILGTIQKSEVDQVLEDHPPSITSLLTSIKAIDSYLDKRKPGLDFSSTEDIRAYCISLQNR